MTPRTLARAAVVMMAAWIIAALALAFFRWDADRTTYCVENGGTAESCGWR